ncbi:MAG: NitT/TauT family transport system substrate-binding protein [Cognaticolwellia sp.]|jgi:NitT/TauT family transport system substrate-binding protein
MLMWLLACTSAPETASEPGLQKVTLALNWLPEPEFGGFYEGVLGGHYEQAGFRVEIMAGGPGAPSLELLQSGKAQAAISAGDDLLLKRAKGIQAIGVWPAFQDAPSGLMVRDPGPTSFSEIPEGSQVAIELGSPFQTFLWQKQGWEGKVRAVPYTGGVGQFLADPAMIQQAYITSEVCVAQSKGTSVRFLKASEGGWNPYGTLLALPDPLPVWAPAFVAATEKAWQAYQADPSRANAEINRLNPALTPEILDCVTKAQAPYLVGSDGLGEMSAERWSAMAETLVGLELLPQGSSSKGAWQAL